MGITHRSFTRRLDAWPKNSCLIWNLCITSAISRATTLAYYSDATLGLGKCFAVTQSTWTSRQFWCRNSIRCLLSVRSPRSSDVDSWLYNEALGYVYLSAHLRRRFFGLVFFN